MKAAIEDNGPLTDKAFWNATWGGANIDVKFCPYKPSFIHFHRLFMRYLPKGNISFFEAGCFPGKYLWYFNKYFGYRVAGIEYMLDKVDGVLKSCAKEHVEAKIISGDFFTYCPKETYDVVGSFGFVEHFQDPPSVVEKHIELTKPGGYIVITVPNHASPLYNKLLRWSGEKIYNAHNHMSYKDLISSVSRRNDVKLVASGHCGHFGLGYTGTFAAVRRFPRVVRLAARLLVLALEIGTKVVPENRILSQAMYVILRKDTSSAESVGGKLIFAESFRRE